MSTHNGEPRLSGIAGAPPDLADRCPNCGALHLASAAVCSACGIQIASFAQASGQIRLAQKERTDTAIEAFTAIASQADADEAVRNRRQFVLLLRLVFAVTALMLVLLAAVFGFRQHQAQMEIRRLDASRTRAADCLERRDYLCSESGFAAYLQKRPHDPAAQSGLQQAQFGLARQYATAQNWPKAEEELRALLNRSPRDAEATALLNQVYDDWSNAAVGRGDWLMVVMIRLKQAVQFPGGG